MRTRLTHMVMAAALLLPGLASAQQDQTDDSAIRYQIAKHLTRASFDAFFPFRDGWRDARKIAQKIEIKVEGRASRQNGAARQTVKWRIKESEGKQVPKLGGVAQIWTYATSARPSYYPRTDVGDVQVMRVAPKGWRLSSAAVSLKPGASESRADLAKRGVQAYLGRQGFGKLLQGRDLSSAGIRVRTSGDSILWKAGRKVGGDGRVS